MSYDITETYHKNFDSFKNILAVDIKMKHH